MKVLIVVYHAFELWQAPPWFTDRLRGEFPGIEVVQRSDYQRITEDIADCDVAITWSLRTEQVQAARKLRWIHSPAAAVHLLMIPEIINSDIVVTNAREIHGPVVAEHAMALVLAMAKRIPSSSRWQARRTWAQEQIWYEFPRPREIAGATLGLIGLGSIGMEVARRAAALGMRVVATREHPERGIDLPGRAKHAVYGPAAVDEVLTESDYVVVAAPITPQTRGLLDRHRIARMKPDAYLINVSRGALVDEAALLDALRHRTIGGAALDVFDEEPLPPESPFWELDNVLITPHTAGLTENLWDRHYAQISENLRRFVAGETLLWQVNKHKGY